MNLGDIYERTMRLPGRRERRSAPVPHVSPGRRWANAAVVPLATALAGRGALEVASGGSGPLAAAGAVAAALTAWLVARWHLASAARTGLAAGVLAVALLVSVGSAIALRWTGVAGDAVARNGLTRGVLAGMALAAVAPVAVSMLGMRRPATGDAKNPTPGRKSD